jgi:hypothetical protein
MYIVAIGWIYVVFMMSITEQSVIAGIMTFLLYGVVPVSILLYLGGSKRRKQRAAEKSAAPAKPAPTDDTMDGVAPDATDHVSPAEALERQAQAHSDPGERS